LRSTQEFFHCGGEGVIVMGGILLHIYIDLDEDLYPGRISLFIVRKIRAWQAQNLEGLPV
jgi:hypothetical protein